MTSCATQPAAVQLQGMNEVSVCSSLHTLVSGGGAHMLHSLKLTVAFAHLLWCLDFAPGHPHVPPSELAATSKPYGSRAGEQVG